MSMNTAALDRRCPGGMNPGRAGAQIRGAYISPSTKLANHWNEHSSLNLRHAQDVGTHAEEVLSKCSQIHAATKLDNQNRNQNVHNAISKKVKSSHALITSLATQIKISATLLLNLQNSHGALKASLKKFEKPLHICGQRQQMRARRPAREQVRDSVEMALEDEKETILNATDKIKHCIHRTEHMVATINHVLQDISWDEECKFHGKDMDIKCQKMYHRTWPVIDGQENVTVLPPVVQGPYINWNIENEERRLDDCKNRIKDAKEMEAAAQNLLDENNETIKGTLAECAAAYDLVGKRLHERVQDIQQMRKRLDYSVREISTKIENMRRNHLQTVSELRLHDEPFDLVAQKDGMRNSRKHRELITDPVSSALSDHKAGLKKNYAELDQCRAEVLQTLAMLEKAKSDLEHDLRDKTASLHIDLDCQKTNSAEQKMLHEMFLL